MNTTTLHRKNGILYPLLVIAATAMIIFSMFGIATMTGLLPRAESMSEQSMSSAPNSSDATAHPSASASGKVAAGACAECGVVQSIRPVTVEGKSNPLGLIAGGITGALLGNQIGRGNGNTIATVAGAAGGAYAGNEIQKNMNKRVVYRIRVRMNDGAIRTVSQGAAPEFEVGAKVKIVNGHLTVVG
jgi:outer membrane lipoprotein SlyB